MKIKAEFAARNVRVMTKTKVTQFCDDGIIVQKEDGTEEKIEADTMINALGFRPAPVSVEMPNACVIGDATGAANILKAVAEGYKAANSI